jgi:phosphopantetheinyl transferase
VRCTTGALPADVTCHPAAAAPPPALRFAYGQHGQPQLQPLQHAQPPLYMSLSHHSNVVAVALAAVPVGVDVVDASQQIAGADSVLDVFKDVLHPLEAQRLQATPSLAPAHYSPSGSLSLCAGYIAAVAAVAAVPHRLGA